MGPNNYRNGVAFPGAVPTNYLSENHKEGIIPWEPNQPSFDPSPNRNVTALKDSNAFLLCIVHNIGNRTVSIQYTFM